MKHVPNILTMARLAASPYIFWLMWTRQYGAVLVWFAVMGLTDGLDGYVARRFHAASKLGGYLDPIADKVLLSGAFLVLWIGGTIPGWLAGLVLGRDLLILLFGVGLSVFSKTKRDFSPSQAGKLSTLLQILFILAVVGQGAGYGNEALSATLAWAVVAVTAWSGLDYAKRAFSPA
ncbi:MAG: CDP-alcohol phosphatidyltransferase family protein [Acidobacteriota bacterium]